MSDQRLRSNDNNRRPGWSERWQLQGDAMPQGAQSHSALIRKRDNGERAFLKECNKDACAERRDRMLREGQILKSVGGTPGIPRLYEAGDSHQPYLILELVEGRRLNELVDARRVSPSDAVSIVLALCEIVEGLHRHGVYHRDIKPDNIMISGHAGAYNVYLVDYGSAYWDNDGFATDVGTELGNRFIRLPEFASGIEAKRMPQSDVTMIVAVLFYLLTGIKPSVPQDQTGAHPHQWPEAREMLRSCGLREDRLARIFDIGFQLDIGRRFQSLNDLRAALEGTQDAHPVGDEAMSLEDIRERLYTPTEAKRQQGQRERTASLEAVRQTLLAFVDDFNGTVTWSQGGWHDRPRRDATRYDLTLMLARDPRLSFTVRAKAMTVGVETILELASESIDDATVRISPSGFDTANTEQVRGYLQRGLGVLITKSEIGDAEAREMCFGEARTLAIDMLTAMTQGVIYYLHQPARDKLAFSKQSDKADVSEDSKYLTAESYMTSRALEANGSVWFRFLAKVEIPSAPGDRDLDCLQEIIIESRRFNRQEVIASRSIRSNEDEIVPMNVDVKRVDLLVDEVLAQLP